MSLIPGELALEAAIPLSNLHLAPGLRATAPRRALRVLHIITGLELGGAEALLVEFVRQGHARGYEQAIVSLTGRGPYTGVLLSGGFRVDSLEMRRGRISLSGHRRFKVLVNSFAPDIIQCWMYHANLFVSAALLIQNPKLLSRTFWGIFASDLDLRRYSTLTRWTVRMNALLARYAAGIIYNSSRAAEIHRGLGFRSRRPIIFNNGIDTEKFRPDAERRVRARQSLGLPLDAVVAIIAARVDPMKDWPTTLAAIARVPDLQALAVGIGTDLLPPQEGLHRLGPRLDMPDLYAAADFLLLPSAFGEGMSLAVSEAMSCGLPVIVTDVGDNASAVVGTGFVVPIGDVNAIAAEVQKLVADADLRHRMGARARALAVTRFDMRSSFMPIFTSYDDVLYDLNRSFVGPSFVAS